jgi:hypothetical protein
MQKEGILRTSKQCFDFSSLSSHMVDSLIMSGLLELDVDGVSNVSNIFWACSNGWFSVNGSTKTSGTRIKIVDYKSSFVMSFCDLFKRITPDESEAMFGVDCIVYDYTESGMSKALVSNDEISFLYWLTVAYSDIDPNRKVDVMELGFEYWLYRERNKEPLFMNGISLSETSSPCRICSGRVPGIVGIYDKSILTAQLGRINTYLIGTDWHMDSLAKPVFRDLNNLNAKFTLWIFSEKNRDGNHCKWSNSPDARSFQYFSKLRTMPGKTNAAIDVATYIHIRQYEHYHVHVLPTDNVIYVNGVGGFSTFEIVIMFQARVTLERMLRRKEPSWDPKHMIDIALPARHIIRMLSRYDNHFALHAYLAHLCLTMTHVMPKIKSFCEEELAGWYNDRGVDIENLAMTSPYLLVTNYVKSEICKYYSKPINWIRVVKN